jgi:hypothetical protein
MLIVNRSSLEIIRYATLSADNLCVISVPFNSRRAVCCDSMDWNSDTWTGVLVPYAPFHGFAALAERV